MIARWRNNYIWCHNVYVPKTDLIMVVINAECYIFAIACGKYCMSGQATHKDMIIFSYAFLFFCVMQLGGKPHRLTLCIMGLPHRICQHSYFAAVFLFQTRMNKAMSSHAPLNSFNLVIETFLATLQIKWPTETP